MGHVLANPFLITASTLLQIPHRIFVGDVTHTWVKWVDKSMKGGLGLVAKEYSILFYAACCTEHNQKHAPLLGSGCRQIPAGNHTPTHRTIILYVSRQSQSKAFSLVVIGLQQRNTSKVNRQLYYSNPHGVSHAMILNIKRPAWAVATIKPSLFQGYSPNNLLVSPHWVISYTIYFHYIYSYRDML